MLLIGSLARPGTQAAAPEAQGTEESISVEVASGRTFAGRLDARTDAAELWLRSGRGAAVLLRPIRWDRVVQIHVAGEDLSPEQFRRIVAEVKPAAAAGKETAVAKNLIVIKGSPKSGGFLSVTDVPPGEAPKAPRVRSLAIDAAVANWDADVEVDGLLVHVYPLDEAGAAVPIRGMLQFDLTGQRPTRFRQWQPFTTVGRWVRQVRPEDFGPRGAVYRLPFQNVHPEFDLTVAPYGSLHARLSVPGQGTFETTQSTVRIRPYSAVRDHLQLSTGRRFFPQERTGDGRR